MTQNRSELDWFISILQEHNVSSFLEIGSENGETLLAISRALPGAKITSVDLPHALTPLQNLRKTIIKIRHEGHDVEFIEGDSTKQNVIKAARKRGPYDACLIDANHTLKYLRKDFANYSPFCRIVAFHDIGWKPKERGPQIDVPEFWEEVKQGYRYREYILGERNNGIGILYTHKKREAHLRAS